MYNIYSIVILILFDVPRFSVNDLHQIQVATPSPSSGRTLDLAADRGDLVGEVLSKTVSNSVRPNSIIGKKVHAFTTEKVVRNAKHCSVVVGG